VTASRDNVAAYVDVEGDLRRWLRLGAAARTEHYSDFGGTLDGKITARLQPARALIIRSSVSSGFRAPSLAQSYFSSTATNFLNLGQGLVPVESLTLPVDSAPAQVLGAVALKPEQSRHVTGGVVITPMAPLEITVDYYRIAIDDRIVLSGNFTAAPIPELLAAFGANSARFSTNAIDTRTDGVDVTSSYRLALGTGNVLLLAGYNHSSTDIVGEVTTPPQLAAHSSVLFDRIERRRIECGQPHDSLRLGAHWTTTRFGVDINGLRCGAFCSFTLNPSDDQEYAAKWLTDVQASYRVGEYRLAIGAQNLFDVFPDRNSTVNSCRRPAAGLTSAPARNAMALEVLGRGEGRRGIRASNRGSRPENYQSLFGLLIAPDRTAFRTSSTVARPPGAVPPHSNRVAAGVQ
jgi:iron complex outermembrane receptor protein